MRGWWSSHRGYTKWSRLKLDLRDARRRRINALRSNSTWHYVFLSEELFYSWRDRGGSMADLLAIRARYETLFLICTFGAVGSAEDGLSGPG
jgi:hypothetical protein